MPVQVVPIADISSAGVIKDTPSISLPPNAYSDVQNIRFHAGAVRKMEGEEDITTEVHTNLDYVLYWKAPADEYYIVVQTDGDVIAYDLTDLTTPIALGSFDASTNAVWQHTLFNGGFNLILNNGVSTPQYLTAPLIASNLTTLPNWDSYLSQEEVVTVVWDEFNTDIALGRGFDPLTETLLYTVTPRSTSIGIINYSLTVDEDLPPEAPFSYDKTDPENVIVTPRVRTDLLTGALPGDQVTISIQNNAEISVTAGVIRAYGNLLIAGNLKEISATDEVRILPGTIRTSDVAAPGAIPLNWNPFRNGANTADEFILSSTGRVQDMAELQGVMYVYTDVSIHAIQQTGNPSVPFQISTTTDSYGCNSLGAVMEFDGRHLVVGSQDVYVFAGHPGSIASIADGRIRHYIYDRPEVDFDVNDIRMVRNQKYDEIWLFSPNKPEMFVWNYRSQAWTIRRQGTPINGGLGPNNPIFCNATTIYNADVGYSYAQSSYIERSRLPLTPEFDTETLGSTALWYTSAAANADKPDLIINMEGSNKPATDIDLTLTDTPEFMFNALEDYKVDTRIQGRFINYRVSDAADNAQPWNLTGYQLEVMKGGKR